MRGRKRTINYDNIDPEIERLYVEEKFSLKRIGEILGIHPEIVKRRCKILKIEVRDLSQAMTEYHYKKRSHDAEKEKEEVKGRTEKSDNAGNGRRRKKIRGLLRGGRVRRIKR